MSKELYRKLCNIKSLVSLRIFIRELLSLDAPELKGQASVDYKNIRELRNLLPAYCKPSVIKEKLGVESDIFTISFKDDVVRFQIDKEFIPKNEKIKVHDEYAESLENSYGSLTRMLPMLILAALVLLVLMISLL